MPDSVVFCVAVLLALAAASLLALVLGAMLAAWLAMARFAARRALLMVLGALAAVPPGLAVAVLGPHWTTDERLAGATVLVAWAMLAAPLALLLIHGPLAASWARYGRALQSAGASRWQALGPLLVSQRRILAVAWLAMLARGLGELAAALALGWLPIPLAPLLPLGLAVVLGGVAVWLKARAVF